MYSTLCGSCAGVWAALRIVIVTDVDSFASVIVALRAGADDYCPSQSTLPN